MSEETNKNPNKSEAESAENTHRLTAEAAPQDNVYNGVYHSLTIGMMISTPLFVLGVALAMMHPAFELMTPAALKVYYHPAYFWQHLVHLDPVAVLLLATLAMILTPVSRVIVSIYAFAKDGDDNFVAITGLVLLIILLTLALGSWGLV